MLTDIEKLRAGALDKAADAIWKWLDPNDEIGRVGIIPNRFNEAAEAAISAHNAFIKEAVKEDERKAFEEWYATTPPGTATMHGIASIAWQAANQANVYRAIVCGDGG